MNTPLHAYCIYTYVRMYIHAFLYLNTQYTHSTVTTCSCYPCAPVCTVDTYICMYACIHLYCLVLQNLTQNRYTLLPKFFGLYKYQSGGTNIRIVAMNNLLPRYYVYHEKFDLKVWIRMLCVYLCYVRTYMFACM